MSKVTPPTPAGSDRLTTKVKVIVPLLPSLSETSLMVRLDWAGAACALNVGLPLTSHMNNRSNPSDKRIEVNERWIFIANPPDKVC
jgi:hypothetical protein